MEKLITLLNTIGSLLIAFAGVYVAYKNSKKVVEETIPTKIKKQCNVDFEINLRMEYIKELLGADRVQIYDFHNGEHYANGRSALKTTCTYEAIRSGIKSYQNELQAVPLTCIPKFIQALLSKEKIECNNLEEIKDTMPATYNLKKSQNVKSFFDVVLNNKNGEPIGFLAIQYSKENCVKFNSSEKEQIYKLKHYIEENLEKMAIKNKREEKK